VSRIVSRAFTLRTLNDRSSCIHPRFWRARESLP
jgi:hypothetical protein